MCRVPWWRWAQWWFQSTLQHRRNRYQLCWMICCKWQTRMISGMSRKHRAGRLQLSGAGQLFFQEYALYFRMKGTKKAANWHQLKSHHFESWARLWLRAESWKWKSADQLEKAPRIADLKGWYYSGELLLLWRSDPLFPQFLRRLYRLHMLSRLWSYIDWFEIAEIWKYHQHLIPERRVRSQVWAQCCTKPYFMIPDS